MLNKSLAGFYERDIRKLIEEIYLFKHEENLWKTHGSIKNSCGNLTLHLIGGMRYLIGTMLAKTGYIRNRDEEFVSKGVKKAVLTGQLEELIPMIHETLNAINMEAEFPLIFDGEERSIEYVLMQLALHLNYHLGQINYLRRILE